MIRDFAIEIDRWIDEEIAIEREKASTITCRKKHMLYCDIEPCESFSMSCYHQNVQDW
jgi:hypothetical protein